MMYRDYPVYKVAVAQLGSVFKDRPQYFDSKATLAKAIKAIEGASKNGARFMVFPEIFLPGYPYWSINLKEGPEFALIWREYLRHSPIVPGPETEEICAAAKKANCYIAMGINERDPELEGRMYNAILFVSSEGKVMGTHRKLNITVHEQLFHTRADVTRVTPCDNIRIYETDIGKLSGLICGEHCQPLLMQHMAVEGEQIHAALWPGYFDYPGAYSLRTVIPAMTQGLCIAAQNWAAVASCYIPPEEIPRNFYSNNIFDGTFGGSCVINPVGEIVAGPLYDSEGIVYYDVDLGVIPLAKSVVNLTGIYDRRDVLSLLRREKPYFPVAPMENTEEITYSEAAETIAHLKERLAKLEAKVQILDEGKEKKLESSKR